MKYAIVEHNSKQYMVSAGDVITVNGTLPADSAVDFTVVLLSDNSAVKLGKDSKVSVKGTVVNSFKGEKIRVAKFKAKSNYHKVRGYRSQSTSVRIEAF